MPYFAGRSGPTGPVGPPGSPGVCDPHVANARLWEEAALCLAIPVRFPFELIQLTLLDSVLMLIYKVFLAARDKTGAQDRWGQLERLELRDWQAPPSGADFSP